MRFHFIWFLVNNIIPRVSHRPLYYVFIEVDFKKTNKQTKTKTNKKNKKIATNLFLKKWAELECENQHTVITYAITFFGKKISFFFWKQTRAPAAA